MQRNFNSRYNVILLLVLLATTFACNNNPANKKPQREDNVLQKYNLTGIYQNIINKNSTLQYKLIQIKDSLYYFEIREINPNNGLINKRNIMGTEIFNDDTLRIINGSEIPFHFNSFINNGNIEQIKVDSINLYMFLDMSDMAGIYNRIMKDTSIIPDYKYQFGNKWSEGHFLKSGSFKLCNFPNKDGACSLVGVAASDTIKTYLNVTSTDSNNASFYYIQFKKNNTVFDGWIPETIDDNINLDFECQENEDGSVEKWNRKDRYTLYFSPNGKLLKKEFDDK